MLAVPARSTLLSHLSRLQLLQGPVRSFFDWEFLRDCWLRHPSELPPKNHFDEDVDGGSDDDDRHTDCREILTAILKMFIFILVETPQPDFLSSMETVPDLC